MISVQISPRKGLHGFPEILDNFDDYIASE